MQIRRALVYWSGDPRWIRKTLTGGIILIIPIIGWAIAAGFFVRTIQSVSAGHDRSLPDWGEWRADFVRGVKVLLVAIVWVLPSWIASGLAGLVAPTGILAATFGWIAFLLGISHTLLTPVFVGRFVDRERITDSLNIRRVFSEARRVPGLLVIYLVLTYLVGALSLVGLLLCVVGVFFTTFIGLMVSGHIVGQIRQVLVLGADPSAAILPGNPKLTSEQPEV